MNLDKHSEFVGIVTIFVHSRHGERLGLVENDLQRHGLPRHGLKMCAEHNTVRFHVGQLIPPPDPCGQGRSASLLLGVDVVLDGFFGDVSSTAVIRRW